MAVIFLTSSPTGPLDGTRKTNGFDEMNGFRKTLKSYWKPKSKCIIACADPSDRMSNIRMLDYFKSVCDLSDMSFDSFDLLDDYRCDITDEEILSYDVIILGGGHVPTQNRFFTEIGLRRKLLGFEGIIIGISAGSMNAAETVYAQPELEGESVDPDYQRFLVGLGLTEHMILPHYQQVKDNYLDGRLLFKDITLPDSIGRCFTVLPDGSYLLSVDGEETVFGEAYKIANGVLTKVCDNGGCVGGIEFYGK